MTAMQLFRTPRGLPRASTTPPPAMSQLSGIMAWVNEDDRNKKDFEVKGGQIEFTPRKTLAIPTGSGTKEFSFTDYSFEQYAKMLKIPATYLESVPILGQGGMKAQVDMRMESKVGKNFLIRVREQDEQDGVAGLVRAILPGNHAVFDNRHLVTAVDRAMKELGDRFELQTTNAHDPKTAERALHMRLVRSQSFNLDEIEVDDPHKIGFHATTSEVGAADIDVNALLYRMVCRNGMMGWAEGNVLNAKHRNFQIHEMNPRIHEAIEASIRQEAAVKDLLMRSYGEEVEDPETQIKLLGQRMKIGEFVTERALDLFKTAGHPQATRFFVMQAFTQAAQEVPFAERTRVEEAVGKAFFGGGGSTNRRGRVLDVEADD